MELDLEELFQVYMVEAKECLASLEEGLLELEQRPDDNPLLDEIFRAAHTLKGNSSSLGFHSFAQFSHEIEELLDLVRKGEQYPDARLISLILRAVDIMNGWLPTLQIGVEHPMNAEQLDVHEQLRRIGKTASAVAGNDAADGVARDGAAGDAAAPTAVRRTLRVDAGRMDALLDLIGEISISAERVRRRLEMLPPELRRDALDTAQDHGQLLRDLHENVMRSRMVAVGSTFRRHLRTVRDLARSTSKQVRLILEGEETEVDMTVVEALSDPLLHMIRNAIDHGIELPQARIAAGKSATGKVTLRAYHDRGEIVVQIADDGRGLQRDKIRTRAARMGLRPEAMSERELFDLIFEPGFTTADTVTATSGRGVGMDVVRRNIDRIRGQIFVETAEGIGTTVSIRLPLTLAVIPGFRVGVGGESFVIPLSAVEECLDWTDGHAPERRDAAGILHLRGDAVPYVRLRHFFGFGERSDSRELVVVVQHQQRRAGLVVDEIYGEAQTVIKPLGSLLRGMPGVTGTAVMGSGAVAMVLDAGAIFRELEKNEADVA
jgi:two-component system chemotaxis sensor kinase CheA